MLVALLSVPTRATANSTRQRFSLMAIDPANRKFPRDVMGMKIVKIDQRFHQPTHYSEPTIHTSIMGYGPLKVGRAIC